MSGCLWDLGQMQSPTVQFQGRCWQLGSGVLGDMVGRPWGQIRGDRWGGTDWGEKLEGIGRGIGCGDRPVGRRSGY